MAERDSALRALGTFAVLSVVIGLTTAWAGWWCVAVVAFAYGIFAGARPRATWPGTVAALAAMFAWADLLALTDVRGGDVGATAARVGAVMHLPPGVLFLATLVFSALLAGPATVLGVAVGRRLRRVG
jgi:hypothetical protein